MDLGASVRAVIAAGSTGGFVAINAAYQTDAAYSHYLDRVDVGDLVVNPSIQTAQIDTVIRTLPGVTDVVSDDVFYAAVGEYSSTDEALSSESADVSVFGWSTAGTCRPTASPTEPGPHHRAPTKPC